MIDIRQEEKEQSKRGMPEMMQRKSLMYDIKQFAVLSSMLAIYSVPLDFL